jgi:catechol 2,3-dioxygenase-like lactoylglutathione lyase family enzyme
MTSVLAASVCAVLPRGALGQTASAVGGWREAVLIVPDFAPWIETLAHVGKWEIAGRSKADTTLNHLWSLPDGARTEQVLMRDIGTDSGMMRLIRVIGAPQKRIRPHDQAWETGGISALDLRVADMDATMRALESRGWNSASDPVRYTTYGKEVVQWAPRSPDGIRLSFIQRIAPPLVGMTELKSWARTGNAAILTADMPVAVAFFNGTLGLKQLSQSDTIGTDGANVMGLPWSFERTMKTDIRGFGADGADSGRIELISIPQARGRDYAANARPPNLGIAGLRFFVPDVAAVATLCAANGSIRAPIQEATLMPYGKARIFAVSAPDGVWLEFIQLRA